MGYVDVGSGAMSALAGHTRLRTCILYGDYSRLALEDLKFCARMQALQRLELFHDGVLNADGSAPVELQDNTLNKVGRGRGVCASWSVGFVVWLVGWSVDWLVGWVGWLVDWLVGWSGWVGWLGGWLVGWLVGDWCLHRVGQ